MVGMSRPKKQRVEKVEALLSKGPVTEMDQLPHGGDMPPSTDAAEVPAAAALVSPSEMSGEEARIALSDLLKDARSLMRGWGRMARQAESDFKIAQRLHDARMACWDRAEARKKKPSAVGQIQKLYKAQLELEKARSKRLAVMCCAAKAQSEQLNMHVDVQAIEIWRLNRHVPAEKRSKLPRLTVKVQD